MLIGDLQPEVERAYAAIAGDEHAATLTGYPQHSGQRSRMTTRRSRHRTPCVPSCTTAADASVWFRSALARLRRSELDRGVTLAGPHRDDLVLTLNGLPARGYASHGESWSFALSLKLASAQVLRRDSSAGDPVIILDDVFAELDESRRGRLAAAIEDFEQVLITAAVYDDVPDQLATHTVRIRAGEIVEPNDRPGSRRDTEARIVYQRFRRVFGDPSLRRPTGAVDG